VADHLLRGLVEDAKREEGDRQAVQNALLQVLTFGGLRVRATFAVEFGNGKELAMIGVAIAVLAADRVGPAALGAFEYPAQQKLRALGAIQTVCRAAVVEFANLRVAVAGDAGG
jgi:hypothetical protein